MGCGLGCVALWVKKIWIYFGIFEWEFYAAEDLRLGLGFV